MLQISAQLRTRLSYAMVKVQNGWEKKSLDDIEDETSQRGSPISAPSRSESIRGPFGSPRDLTSQRRPSAISEDSDQMMLSPHQASAPESRPRAATSCLLAPSILRDRFLTGLAAFWQTYSGPVANNASDDKPENNRMEVSILAPAAEIGPRRKRRSSASFHPPSLLNAGQRKYYSDLGAGSHTPGAGAPRAGILRMPSQQAEKDAVDTLLFMSSPNNTGRLPHTSSEGLPKGGLPARRVMFENEQQAVPRNRNGYNPSEMRRP